MKKVILLSLLLAPFAACKKDSITEVAQPAENIETLNIVTTPVQNGEAADRGTCTLYMATRFRQTASLSSSTVTTTSGTYQLWRHPIAGGADSSISPALNLGSSTGKNVSWTVSDDGLYTYYIKYNNFAPTTGNVYAHTYWADNIMVQVNPTANADVQQQYNVAAGGTGNFSTVAARVSTTCVVTP